MARVFLHGPLNINRPLGEMVKSFCGRLEEKYNMAIEVTAQTCHRHDGDWLLEACGGNRVPDMTFTYATDFSGIGSEGLREFFQSAPAVFQLRPELATRGLADRAGIFHPVFLVPFVIIFNRQMVAEDEIPKKWEDLLQPKWRGAISLTDASLPASKVFTASMRHLFPDRAEDFLSRVLFQGSPVDVKNAVDEGRHPLGVANVSFSRYARQKNIGVVWPAEGAFFAIQVMVWRKGADHRLLDLAGYLVSPPVQEFFARQGYIPVNPDVPLPPEAEGNHCRLSWAGWDRFFEIYAGNMVS